MDLVTEELRTRVWEAVRGVLPLDTEAVVVLVRASTPSPRETSPYEDLEVEGILSRVAIAYRVRVKAIRGSSRHPEVVEARHIAWFVMRDRLGMSYPRIARWFRRDHSTVMAGIRRVETKRASIPSFAARLQVITATTPRRPQIGR